MSSAEDLKSRLIDGAQGKAILFAGSGCSIGCLNYDETGLPTVNPLLELLNSKLPITVSRLDVAASMVYEKDPKAYLNLLNDTYYVKSVPDSLVSLMEFEWNRVYTTNYDNALELAASRAKRKVRPLVPTDDPKLQPKGVLQIVHLHGYIERFDLDNVGKDCILDYDTNLANAVYDGHWADLLRNDVVNADVVVFVGYSLYDPQIAKLLKSTHFTREKIFFINSAQANPELEYIQMKFGHPKSIEQDGFVKVLASAKKQGLAKIRENFVCFERVPDDIDQSTNIRQSDLSDLFLFGNFDWKKAQRDITEGHQSYVVKRDLIEVVEKKLSTGSDFISIFAPLGYGKTIFAQTLASALRAAGEHVFVARRNQSEFSEELEEIVSQYDNPVIIFDDFFRYTKHWNELSLLGGKKVRIVATARVNVFSSRERDIREKFLNHDPETLKLGSLSVGEARCLVPLVTQAGLWQQDAALNDVKKLNKIRDMSEHGYQNNFADILIGLMKSNDIVGRLRKELNTLKEISRECYDGVLLTIYLEFVNNDPDTSLLAEGFGNDMQNFFVDPETDELLRVFLIPDGKGIRYKSSVFSKFALETTCDPDDVVHVVKDTVVRLATSTGVSNDYSRLLADLMRFNYLKGLCNDGNFDRTFAFYDELSALPEINRDDLFWNAFGMCQRARLDYPSARRHFNNSIALAANRGPHYIPYHAQNQLIVCIFEMGIMGSLDKQSAHSDLLETIRLLMIQADDERSHGTGQAFSWHAQLQEFSEKYFVGFDASQKRAALDALKKYAMFIRNHVEGWQNRSGASRMVSSIAHLENKFSIR